VTPGGSFSAEPSSPLAQPMPDAEGAVCTMRPGDPGFDECEACQ